MTHRLTHSDPRFNDDDYSDYELSLALRERELIRKEKAAAEQKKRQPKKATTSKPDNNEENPHYECA